MSSADVSFVFICFVFEVLVHASPVNEKWVLQCFQLIRCQLSESMDLSTRFLSTLSHVKCGWLRSLFVDCVIGNYRAEFAQCVLEAIQVVRDTEHTSYMGGLVDQSDLHVSVGFALGLFEFHGSFLFFCLLASRFFSVSKCFIPGRHGSTFASLSWAQQDRRHVACSSCRVAATAVCLLISAANHPNFKSQHSP